MACRGSRGIALLFLDHGTRRRWGVSVTPRPLFTPRKYPVPIVLEAGWAPGPIWTGMENLAPTGIRFPHCPARSQSLYRLRYPALFPQLTKCHLMHKEQQKTTFVPSISSMLLAELVQGRNTVNKDEYQNSCLLRRDAVSLGEWFLTFWKNCISSSSGLIDPRIILLELTDPFKMKAIWSFKKQGISHPTTLFNILKDPNL